MASWGRASSACFLNMLTNPAALNDPHLEEVLELQTILCILCTECQNKEILFGGSLCLGNLVIGLLGRGLFWGVISDVQRRRGW